jgi:hypothetical protein
MSGLEQPPKLLFRSKQMRFHRTQRHAQRLGEIFIPNALKVVRRHEKALLGR